jgi:hypothetical protein
VGVQAGGPVPLLFWRMMTRNTKLYKATIQFNNKDTVIEFRTLTVSELGFLNGINSIIRKNEIAGRLAFTYPDIDLPWGTLCTIGERAISRSMYLLEDDDILEVTIKDIRQKLETDPIMGFIIAILRKMPSLSLSELLEMTPTDIIELACVVENITGTSIFAAKFSSVKRKGRKLVNPSDLASGNEELKNRIDAAIKGSSKWPT